MTVLKYFNEYILLYFGTANKFTVCLKSQQIIDFRLNSWVCGNYREELTTQQFMTSIFWDHRKLAKTSSEIFCLTTASISTTRSLKIYHDKNHTKPIKNLHKFWWFYLKFFIHILQKKMLRVIFSIYTLLYSVKRCLGKAAVNCIKNKESVTSQVSTFQSKKTRKLDKNPSKKDKIYNAKNKSRIRLVLSNFHQTFKLCCILGTAKKSVKATNVYKVKCQPQCQIRKLLKLVQIYVKVMQILYLNASLTTIAFKGLKQKFRNIILPRTLFGNFFYI